MKRRTTVRKFTTMCCLFFYAYTLHKMTKNDELAHTLLFADTELDADTIQCILHQKRPCIADITDLYAQKTTAASYVLEDSIIKSISHHTESGIGCRIIAGEKIGFTTTALVDGKKALVDALETAYDITKYGSVHGNVTPVPHALYQYRYQPDNPITALETQQIIDFLHRLDQQARAHQYIKKVNAQIAMNYSAVAIVTPETIRYDIRPLVRFSLTVLAEKNGVRRTGNSGGGGRMPLMNYLDTQFYTQHIEDAVQQAHVGLEARAAPAGTMPVVLGSGWPGVLLHEAVGHGLEGDFNRKGTSVYSGKIGEQIASPLCTVIDDGTIDGRRGSLTIDDEGIATQKNLLIEDGVLVGYMQDRHNAHLMGVQPTGNGRRESYAHLPMPRMTNTYMENGTSTQEEMIASINEGLFAVNFSGGQVDITTGQFVFSASLAYKIEKGKISHPVHGATLIGKGKDVMTVISMVGNDLAFDSGVGTCGKNGQSVPVGVGQPSLKIDQIVVGGSEL